MTWTLDLSAHIDTMLDCCFFLSKTSSSVFTGIHRYQYVVHMQVIINLVVFKILEHILSEFLLFKIFGKLKEEVLRHGMAAIGVGVSSHLNLSGLH